MQQKLQFTAIKDKPTDEGLKLWKSCLMNNSCKVTIISVIQWKPMPADVSHLRKPVTVQWSSIEVYSSFIQFARQRRILIQLHNVYLQYCIPVNCLVSDKEVMNYKAVSERARALLASHNCSAYLLYIHSLSTKHIYLNKTEHVVCLEYWPRSFNFVRILWKHLSLYLYYLILYIPIMKVAAYTIIKFFVRTNTLPRCNVCVCVCVCRVFSSVMFLFSSTWRTLSHVIIYSTK